ncbi:hypothetical protein BS47DRAFT_1369163 [Hydnum rufescens UP504]|uniref:Uncharacterized protein n=1 Tax=Hydnum rufescens UP504 TaxID=1448309 RepID=A0A9P6DMC1_9AGAM|nr:hypothetical protein BS47DRAFT_1369163 [Hydnum rufescens UP504]
MGARAATQDLNLAYPQPLEQQIKYATHPLQQGLIPNPTNGLIPNPTNVQTTPRTKHRSMQPPLSPDPRFYAMTKQIHATHLPKQGLIPNPMNVQTMPRTKHGSTQPPLSPDPQFYATMKQICATHPPKQHQLLFGCYL